MAARIDAFFPEDTDPSLGLVQTLLFVGLIPDSLSVALYTTEVHQWGRAWGRRGTGRPFGHGHPSGCVR